MSPTSVPRIVLLVVATLLALQLPEPVTARGPVSGIVLMTRAAWAVTDPTNVQNVTLTVNVQLNVALGAKGNLTARFSDSTAASVIGPRAAAFKAWDEGSLQGTDFVWRYTFAVLKTVNLFDFRQATLSLELNGTTARSVIIMAQSASVKVDTEAFESQTPTGSRDWSGCNTHCAGINGGWRLAYPRNAIEATELVKHLKEGSVTRFTGASSTASKNFLCWRSPATFQESECSGVVGTNSTWNLAQVTGASVTCMTPDWGIGQIICPALPTSADSPQGLIYRATTDVWAIASQFAAHECLCTRWATPTIGVYAYTAGGGDNVVVVGSTRTLTPRPPTPSATVTTTLPLTETPGPSFTPPVTGSDTTTLSRSQSQPTRSASSTPTISTTDSESRSRGSVTGTASFGTITVTAPTPSSTVTGGTLSATQIPPPTETASATLTLTGPTVSVSLTPTVQLPPTPSATATLSATGPTRSLSASGSAATATASKGTASDTLTFPTDSITRPTPTRSLTYPSPTVSAPTPTKGTPTQTRSPPPTVSSSLTRTAGTASVSDSHPTASTSFASWTPSRVATASRTISVSKSFPTPSRSKRTVSVTATRSVSRPTASASAGTASDAVSASDEPSTSPSDAVTATVEPRPLRLEFTNRTVPYAGWADFVERGRGGGDFTRILEATMLDGGFILEAVDRMSNRRVGAGEGALIPPPHSLCTTFNAGDETSTIGRYVRENVTVLIPPDERAAAQVRGDGIARRAWIVFRGFTDAAKVGIFGADPDGAVEASVPRAARAANVAFTMHCFARSATPFDGPISVTLQPPPPTPIASVESAKGVAKAATQVVAVAGAVVSGATIAAQVSRTAFALGMVQCQPDPDQLDWPQNPFGRSVGPGDAGIWAGAALFNPIFLGIIGVVLAGAGYVLSVVDDMSLQSAFAVVRFPSLLSFFLLLVTDATIQAAVISIIFGEGHHKALGVIVLLLGLATVGFVSSKLYFNFGGTLVRNADPLTGWRRVLFGTDRWLDTTSITATQRFEAMQGRYDAIKGNCVLRLVLKAHLADFEALQERLRLAEEQPAPVEGNSEDVVGGGDDGLDDLLLPAKVTIDDVEGDDHGHDSPRKQTPEERQEALYTLVLPAATTARGFCKRNKMFFDEYNDRIPHFFAFEFIVVFATGILEGFKLGSGKCEFVALTFFMMMLGYLVVILITQPNVSRYDFGFAVGGTVIQLGSAACFLVGWWSKNAFLFSMSAVLVEAGMYLLILKMILDSAKAVTKFTLLFLNNRRKALQRALLSAEKRKPKKPRKKTTPPPEPEEPAEVPLIELPPPPPPKPPTPPPPPSSSSSDTEELPPPPPPVRAKPVPRRPEVDGLRLAVDNSLRIANRRGGGGGGRSEADVLEAVLKARNAREAHAAIDKSML